MSCGAGKIGTNRIIAIDGNPTWQYALKKDRLVCDDDEVAIGMCTKHPGITVVSCPNLYTSMEFWHSLQCASVKSVPYEIQGENDE